MQINKLKALAKKEGIDLVLVEKRKQLSGVGVILDFDVKCGKVNRVKITEDRNPLLRTANIYYDKSSKIHTEFKTESELIKSIKEVA